MATKRTFISIAQAMSQAVLGQAEKRRVAEALADVLAEGNPRFDREVFIRACLRGEGKENA